MSILLISISHKNAPLAVRNLFAFTKEQQKELMEELIGKGGFAESLVISTCNRTEIYVYQEPFSGKAEDLPCENGENGVKSTTCSKDGEHLSQNAYPNGFPDKKRAFPRMQELILKKAQAENEEHITDYLRFYKDNKAIHHLFWVAAGLDSMVVGEDQILGQVKRAQEQAMEAGTAGKILNTLFRYAITAAKKVKTETELSKTSVSTATLAIKAGEEYLGSLEGKKVMVIGGTGKIGGIVLKNLYSMKGIHIYSTVRSVALSHDCHAKNESATVIDYRERYACLDEMDLVISATSSPHYTLTYDKTAEQFHTRKPRVFVDLAVPPDIDGRVGSLSDTQLYNVDDFSRLARENNVLKEQAARDAGNILADCEKDFRRWLIFQQSVPILKDVRSWMVEEAGKKGFEKAIDKFFYRLREQAEPDDLAAFFADIRDMEH